MFLVFPDRPSKRWTPVLQNSKWVFKRVVDKDKPSGGHTTTPVVLNPFLEIMFSKPEEMHCIRRTVRGRRWLNERARLRGVAGTLYAGQPSRHVHLRPALQSSCGERRVPHRMEGVYDTSSNPSPQRLFGKSDGEFARFAKGVDDEGSVGRRSG